MRVYVGVCVYLQTTCIPSTEVLSKSPREIMHVLVQDISSKACLGEGVSEVKHEVKHVLLHEYLIETVGFTSVK